MRRRSGLEVVSVSWNLTLNRGACDCTRLPMLEAWRLESWVVRSRSQLGKSTENHVLELPLSRRCRCSHTQRRRRRRPAGRPGALSASGCALQAFETLILETPRIHLSKPWLLHGKLRPTGGQQPQYQSLIFGESLAAWSQATSILSGGSCQPHLGYHYPNQGGLMLASVSRYPARYWGPSVPGPYCWAHGKHD